MTKKNILLCSVMALFLWTACSEAEKYQYPFQNPKLKVEERQRIRYVSILSPNISEQPDGDWR